MIIAGRPADLAAATHVVLPGVGAFPKGMQQLRTLGFEDALRDLASRAERKLLGVCLGMQLLAALGEEHELCGGLGFIPGRVVRLSPPGLRIPHVGWNDTVSRREDSLLGSPGACACFYYVHSYHLVPEDEQDISMTCEYGQAFAAGVARQNIAGVQFHPEKSHAAGLNLLRRFVERVE